MLNTASAAASLQGHFKKTFDNVEKDVDLAVNHFVRAAGDGINQAEVQELRKRIFDSFTDVKKLVVKFNASALFFIGINVDPLNPRLHDLVTGSRDELSALLRRRKSKTAKDCGETLSNKTAKVFKEAETVSQTPVTNTSTVSVKTAVVKKAEPGSTNEKPVKKRNCASDDKARVSSLNVIV